MKILGIESSADETAAAVVEDGRKLLSSVVATSLDLHTAFGGIVPEIAARSHIEAVIPVVDQALKDAKTDWKDIDAIAVTQGPGLIGSLIIGVLTARTLAIAKDLPLIAVNHIEAHVYANFITDTAVPGYQTVLSQPLFHLLALIVSGGHTQLVLFEGHGNYKLLGQTRDDAVGEAFDKVAKILGLPYPGGPSVSEIAKNGNPDAIKLPTAKMSNPYDFSFSGLKTAVLRASQLLVGKKYDFPSSGLPALLNEQQRTDIAASFQRVALETLVNSLDKAAREFQPQTIVIAGGVAASQELRRLIEEKIPQSVTYPDFKLCTDNAAMIATLAYYKQEVKADPYSLEPLSNYPM